MEKFHFFCMQLWIYFTIDTRMIHGYILLLSVGLNGYISLVQVLNYIFNYFRLGFGSLRICLTFLGGMMYLQICLYKPLQIYLTFCRSTVQYCMYINNKPFFVSRLLWILYQVRMCFKCSVGLYGYISPFCPSGCQTAKGTNVSNKNKHPPAWSNNTGMGPLELSAKLLLQRSFAEILQNLIFVFAQR